MEPKQIVELHTFGDLRNHNELYNAHSTFMLRRINENKKHFEVQLKN